MKLEQRLKKVDGEIGMPFLAGAKSYVKNHPAILLRWITNLGAEEDMVIFSI